VGLTHVGTSLLKVFYFLFATPDMAPEMLGGEQYEKAVDMYGVGVLLYELLTGQNPFKKMDGEFFVFELSILQFLRSV